MIPVKIITKKEAVRLGLTKQINQPSGSAGVGGGAVVEVGPDGRETAVETYIEKQNGDKEIIFMAKKRKDYLKSTNDFAGYLKQFKKFEGKKITKKNIYDL